jgi:hypothetical protein
MPELIDTPEFRVNLMVAALALIMIFHARADRASHRVLFGFLTALVLVRYVAWRLAETLPPADLGFGTLLSWVFLAFEMVAIVYTLLSIQMLTRRRDNHAQADRGEAALRARGANVPAVDVFICTYNEELGVLEKTIFAAQAIDYPHVNVWVLDDTRRDWLREYCERKGVHYARRPDNAHAKAGNLNNGLRLSAAATNAPYILVLDADFTPHRNIAYRTLGLFDEPGGPGADAAVLLQRRPHPAQPARHRQLGRRAARVLRRAAARQGRGRRGLLRGHLVRDPARRHHRGGRLPHGQRVRGHLHHLHADALRLGHALAQRAAVERALGGQHRRLHQPAQPLVPGHHPGGAAARRAAARARLQLCGARALRARPAALADQALHIADARRARPVLVHGRIGLPCHAARLRHVRAAAARDVLGLHLLDQPAALPAGVHRGHADRGRHGCHAHHRHLAGAALRAAVQGHGQGAGPLEDRGALEPGAGLRRAHRGHGSGGHRLHRRHHDHG